MSDNKLFVSNPRIFKIRGIHVILDSDLAVLYGVSTGAFNQAIKRNMDRFPGDFSFILTEQEFISLISQTVISKFDLRSRSQFATLDETFRTTSLRGK